MKLRLAAAAGIAVMGLAALAGCGVKGANGAGALPVTQSTAAATPTGAAAPPAAGRPIKLVVEQTSLGPTLTFDGLTVYRFESDSNKPPTSVCEGPCLTTWPPLLTDGTAVQVDASIDSATVGVLNRTDGSVQVTLNGWPLYLYSKDTQAGDVKGEGVGGKWSVVDGAGKPLKKK